MRFPLALALALLAAAPAARAQAADTGLAAATQAVVVTAASWDSVDAVLRRYERDTPSDAWRAIGPAIPAAVGRAGMGWGIGLHPPVEDFTPHKREGDGRAPAGVFALRHVFGYADEAAWVRMPYLPSTEATACVDDPHSAHYNRRVDRDSVTPDWASHEEMRRGDPLYRWGVWVGHNDAPPRAMGGSCIFLHVWAGPGVATSGCTAMAEDGLRDVIAWLRPEARPVLVQLPRAEYARLRGAWRLP